MKKAKKLLVALLVLTFLLSTLNVGFAADEELPSEVVRAQALGILKGDEQGNLNLDKPITRAEALALIVRISGLESSANLMTGQTQFPDVNADAGLQWATGYINLGVGQEIINGYPDGTFKGRNEVTYAEMAKMLLYAMNYGKTVEGAPWPAGVMGKADDLDLFDDVNALPNVPALRGDVVKMIDNSLTVSHLKQTGYGDLAFYEEDPDTTFLSKMKVDELKGYVVTKIDKVSGSKLDENEIVLTKYDKDGDVEDTKTLTLIADESAEEIFGLKVDAWVNDDDEVFFVKVKTAASDILVDSVDAENTDANEIGLYVEDDKFEWADNAEIYVNFDDVTKAQLVGMVDEGVVLFGKVVLEKGEAKFANLFKFDSDNLGLVTAVEDEVIEFANLVDGDDEELDLEDFDNAFVYNKDFSAATIEDIKEDSVIAYWEAEVNKDDNVYIVVVNEVVEGTLERIKDKQIRVDGTNYDRAENAIVSLDQGDKYNAWDGITDIEDLADEEVIVFLDYNGEAVAIRGDVDVTSDTIYGIATYAKVERDGVLTVFTKDGEKVDYTAEDRGTLNPIKYNTLDYFADFDEAGFGYAIVAFKLNKDGEISKNDFDYVIVSRNNVVSDVSFTDNEYTGTLTKSADKTLITLSGGEKFYLTENTVIMKALDATDKDLDPEVLSYESIVEMEISSNSEAVVYGKNGKNANLVVFLNKDFEGTGDDYFFGVVTDSPWKVGKNYVATIDVAGEGKEEYKVADKDNFAKGTLVAFRMNSKGEADAVVAQYVYESNNYENSFDKSGDGIDVVEGRVDEVDGSFITLDEGDVGTYKVADDAVIYNIKKDGSFKLGSAIRLSKIDKDDYVVMVLDKDDIVRAMVVYYNEDR